MAVVVNNDLIAELLALYTKPLWPVGAMANNDANYSIHRYVWSSPWLT